ncbi:LANO_0E10682g1_1 [Lachancea nothofagi CBS 11611]|uniref:mRNA export factor GLE1 n=1 Tax=Lachancea nothofagi CBS 11611 TaxID=1266666 RepID=A0A1G4JWW7_9SACH|nr:LANO_0E10682g1_1 [Lachancea nothofagi CBS 11611]
MRFSFDELYAVDEPELLDDDEYTIIESDDEDIPRLRIPRYKGTKPASKNEEDKLDKLDPELEHMLAKLNLSAKIPGPAKITRIGNWRKNVDRDDISTEPSACVQIGDNHIKNTMFAQLQAKMVKNYMKKLALLENCNEEQVRMVKTEKQRILEEEKRRKEEQKRQEMLQKQREEADRRKQQEEERKKREEEEQLRQKALQEAKQREEEKLLLKKEKEKQESLEAQRKAQEEAAKGKGLTNFHEVETTFKHYKHKIKHIKMEVVEPVKKDTALKSILSKHKRRINPKFGQLTNSEQHLRTIVSELTTLVDQTKPNKLGYEWILNFIAKALVSQAETEVRVKPESALPLAKLALYLLARYSELLEFLMARFIKKCPFVIGYTCNIDSEEGRYKMGWKRARDDAWEDETSYDERMGGIVTFFATISRLPLPQELITTHKHPLPISHSWQLLARTANTSSQLLTNTHFVVLGSWWDAAAAQFLQAFGKQAHKLLVLLTADLTNSVADRRYVGAARLRILWEEYEIGGLIKSFPEMSA